MDGSDKDWLEFVYPTWDDIIRNEIISKEIKNDDGSFTKIKDIRLIPKMIKKANFNDLQFLFSQEMYDCKDIKWFIDHRQELVRADMWQLYCSNVGYIKSQLKENTNKSIIRAYAFTSYLQEILKHNEFTLRNDYFRRLREHDSKQIRKDLIKIIGCVLPDLEKEYEKYKHKPDARLINEIYEVTKTIVQSKLG